MIASQLLGSILYPKGNKAYNVGVFLYDKSQIRNLEWIFR